MNACAHARSLIDDALDGRLDAGARSGFDAHLRQCAACAAEWEFASSVRSSLLKVGLDPAPAGLKESIAAQVRQLGGHRTASTAQAPARTGGLRSPPFLRAAAGILAVVAISWVVLRQKTEAPPPEGSVGRGGAVRADVAEKDSTLFAKAKPPAAITVEPVGDAWSAAGPSRDVDFGLALGAARAEALDKARAVALGREAAAQNLDRSKSAAPPEQWVRQAETLVWLEANLGALSDAAGETLALKQLVDDADAALSEFAGGAKARDGAEKKTDDDVSALKVTEARQTEGASDRAAGARRDQQAAEPASYMVTGPGVIARVKRVLEDRGVTFDPVWLKDQDPNERKRMMEQEATGYRIVEADVPASALNEIIGDLESLDGVRLAPIGRGEAPRAVLPEAALAKEQSSRPPSPTGGTGGRAGTGAPAPAARTTTPDSRAGAPISAAKPKLLGMRKLRLVLISR